MFVHSCNTMVLTTWYASAFMALHSVHPKNHIMQSTSPILSFRPALVDFMRLLQNMAGIYFPIPSILFVNAVITSLRDILDCVRIYF